MAAEESNARDAVPLYVEPLQRKFSTSLDKLELLPKANSFIKTTPPTNENEISLVVSINPFLRMADFKEPSLNTIQEAIIMPLSMTMATMRLSLTILYFHTISYQITRLVRGIGAVKSKARMQRSSEGRRHKASLGQSICCCFSHAQQFSAAALCKRPGSH